MHDEERVSTMIGPGSVNTAHPAVVLPPEDCHYSVWRTPNESLF